MTQYQKECMYCKEKITMSDETGKWLPYNSDGSAHDCRTNTNGNGKSNSEVQTKGPKKYTLEEVVRKLESIGVIIDIGRVMNQE